MFRTILAVIAGFALWSLIWLGGSFVLPGLFPAAVAANGSSANTGYLLSSIVVSLIASLAAGYLARAIAKAPGLAPQLALGVILLPVGIAVESGYWGLLPLWYHLVFLVLLLPATLAGAWLRSRS